MGLPGFGGAGIGLRGQFVPPAGRMLSEARLNVTAVNKISALPGDRVIIESSGLKFFSIAALVYILPLAFFLAAYFLATLLNAMESVCILISTGAFIVGCLAVYLINKFIRRDRKLDFEIVSFAP